MESIYRIAPTDEVRRAVEAGEFCSSDLLEEGFIHCAFFRQVEFVANCKFRGRSDLALLEIDPLTLNCELRVENLDGGEELYPHVYGAIPMESVLDVLEFPCRADGTFGSPTRALG